jgi:VWFA-related protein
MNRFRSLALIGGLLLVCFCLACLPLCAQENLVVRVGVATLQNGPGIVPGAEARDRLVKAINQRKADKNSQFVLEAVALQASSPGKAIAEAREKNCQFVLYTRLTDLTTSSQLSSMEGIYLPAFHATVEYQLNHVADGSGFAINSVEAEDSASSRGAVWSALPQVANKASSDIQQGKGTPNAPAVAGMSAAGLAVPSLVQYVNARDYCRWLPGDIAHADALRGICEYAISLPEKMPNFVCGQETARYRGDSGAPVDLISASVLYEDGHESYSDIRVNDHPLSGDGAGSQGLRSTGEFGGNLRAIFNRTNHALFSYSGEGKVGEHAAWIFTYQIAEQKEQLWMLHAPDQIIAPRYSGELWIDQKGGGVLRFRSVAEAKDLPQTFPMKNVDLQIDYEEVGFGDGTNFVLPVDSTLTNVYSGEETSRNVVRFRNCHKFRARGRLVLNAGRGSTGSVPSGSVPEGSTPAAQVPASAASLQKDLDESEAIFAAIRDRALQQDEVQREGEQRRMLDAATESTLQRFSKLRREQQEIQAQRQTVAVANAKSDAATAAANDRPRTAFRVDVRLVPVSVVLRDGKGQAVGSMGQDNFRLFDEGRLQVIKQFSVEAAEARIAAERATEPVRAQEAVPPVQPVTDQGSPAAGERATAYLFDDLHSNFAELARARDAAVRHLGALESGESAALFTTSGAVVIDFTDDREKLLAGLRSLKPRAINFESDCPPISPYIADLMINKRDSDANSLAVAEVTDCAFQGSGGSSALAQRLATAKAVEVLDSGNTESKNAIEILSRVIRRTASMPGQRSIVLVSPGFLALTPDLLEDVMALIEGAVHSGIIINALDAHGLSTAGVSGKSSLPGPNGFLFANAEAQALGDVMAEFASGTGGVFFHNNNNLDEGFRRTADAPAFVYVLGFSPQKLDGRFHKLKVTLTSAEKFEVQARRGYYAFKPSSTN